MKKILSFLLLFYVGFASAQDTTSFRFIGISSNMEIDFFYDDSTSMGDVDLTSSYATGHAIFVNPADNLIYTVLDTNGSGDRNLYRLNPLTGNYTLVHNFTAGYINSAAIGKDGRVYAITGNGGGVNGQIFALDLNTMTESNYFTSAVSDSRGIEYNPVDSSMYIYEGYSDKLYKINMNTVSETSVNTTGMNDELHGVYFDTNSNIFLLSAYGGEMYTTDATWLSGTMYHDMDNGVTGNNVMDISSFNILNTDSAYGFCPGDSIILGGLYSVDSLQWYRNDTLIVGATDSSLVVKQPGDYKALIAINMDQGVNYIWSESITVTQYTVPGVNIISVSGTDTICPGDTIELSGANGGTLQWFLNGNPISGANSNTYEATTSGFYNQQKINMSGCSAMAATDFEIIDGGPDCFTGIEGFSSIDIEFYPNPVKDILTVQSSAQILGFEVYSLVGNKLASQAIKNKYKVQVDFSELSSGIYFVMVRTNEGLISKKVLK